LLIAGVCGLSTARAQDSVPDGSVIVLIRHAEKAAGNGDVALAPAGVARAEALTEVLRDAGISAIVTTTALRTQQTAQPLGALLHLTAIAVERNDVEQTVLERLPAAVLVIGHSETVPSLVRAFGGPEVEISAYDDLFVITRADGVTRFIHGRYGPVSP
jgi:phosphohistidine phosphatase SixA